MKKTKMKNKKAMSGIGTLIMFVIAVFVFVVLIHMVYDLLTKQSSQTSGYLDDYDNDGVKDNLDKCKCDYGDEDNKGCPEDCEYAIDQKTACNEAMKDEDITGEQCTS